MANQSPYKVAFIISSLPLGGKESILVDVIHGLNPEAFQSVLFVAKGGGALLKNIPPDRLIVALPSDGNVLRSVPALWRFLRQEKPDILWCVSDGVMGFFGQLLGMFLRIPVRIISLHGQHQGVVMDAPNRWLARRFTHRVVTVSHAFRERLIAEGLPANLIEVHYNGVDVETFTLPENRGAMKAELLGISPSRLVVGTVGSLRPVKAQAVLLQAAKRVIEAVPDVLFVLIGDGVLRQDLEQLCDELGIKENVRFLGQREDVPAVMGAFDIFALTSDSESFGGVVIQAMASGLPVVSSAVGGVPEIVTDETGILVPARDVDSLAQALIALLGDAARRKQMGGAGRKRVLAHFQQNMMIAQREALLHELLGGAV